MKFSFIVSILSFIYATQVSSLCNTTSLTPTDYCSYFKRIDSNKLTNENANFKLDEFIKNNENFNYKIKSIYTQNQFDYLSNKIDENDFYFFLKSEQKNDPTEIFMSLRDENGNPQNLANKNIKFKLKGSNKCFLTIEFYDSNHQIVLPSDEFTSLIKNNDETLIYYEAYSNVVDIDLRRVVPGLFCYSRPYSIVCLKCNFNNIEQNMLNMSISNDALKIVTEPFADKNMFYNDIVLLLEQESSLFEHSEQGENNRFYLNIRVFNLETESFKSSSIDKRLKRFSSSNQKKYAQLNSNVNQMGPQISVKSQMHMQNIGNLNMLKTAQLAITEETIGLQTKLKIYDYVWVDYQLNASDYVKQRIQLIAPDNPILNITKPFDYETGGPIHNFQIIFTRKVDKRTS